MINQAEERKVEFRVTLGVDFLREKQAAVVAAQLIKRQVEKFKAREGLDANRNNEGNEASD
jgi:hypothetical protein